MKPKSAFRRFLLACSSLLAVSSLHADTLTWDPSGGGTSDGAGTWLNTGVWWNGANVDWNNTTPDNAIIGNGGNGGTITLGAVTAGTVLLDNFSGTYTFNGGSLDQSGGITIGTTAGTVEIKSPISGAGGINANNGGYVNLRSVSGGSALTYTGPTVITNGTQLQFNNTSVIDNPNSNTQINGGTIYKYYNATINYPLGAGPGELQILGGASGFTGNNTLTVNLGGSAAEVVWGSTHFQPSTLILMEPNHNDGGKVEFKNALDLNGAPRTIAVNKDPGGSDAYGLIDGLIRNSDVVNPSGITKTGPGNLRFTNTGNSYDGPTIVSEGVLQLGTAHTNAQSIPGGISTTTGGLSNLEINGGNVRFAYYMRRPLGSGPTDIQITGGTSGFSHIQADTYGRISFNNDNSYEVVWGSAFFQPDVFVLNEDNAVPDQVVNFQNKLDLNGADRTVATNSTRAVSSNYVNNNNGNMLTCGGRITGDIRTSSGTAGLIKTGPGHLQLTGTNTYNGGTTINEGTVQFTKLLSMPATGDVEVNDGTRLIVNLGGGGEWTAGSSGNGTLGGLLGGLGGQAGSTVTYNGDVALGIVPSGTQVYSGVVGDVGTSLAVAHSGAGSLELSGDNTFSGGLVVDGGGQLILSGDNSGASGGTLISNGYLDAGTDAAGLPVGTVTFSSSGSNPAILQAKGTLNTNFGSDIKWTGPGGFAATDSALTVTTNGGAPASWRNSSGFNNDNNPQMGSPTSTASVTITNDLSIGYNSNIRLFDNAASSADISILAGDLTMSGNYTLQVNGAGTLSLPGTNDFKSGTLQLNNRTIVRAVDGTGLNATVKLLFNNGILESSGTFTRDINNSAGNVYWNNLGGFAAAGGPLTVNLEGGVDLAWNSGTVGFNGKNPLYLGSETADNVVTLENNIALAGDRTIRVYDNPDTPNDYAVVSGVISGSNKLTKDGDGTLVLSGDNTYTGDTTVSAGTLIINGDQTSATGLVDVKSGKNLGGTGTIGGNVTVENTGGLMFNLSTAAGSHDKLDVLGSFTFESASVLTITSSGGASPGTYTLVTAGSAPTGSVPATINLPAGWTADAPQIVGNDLVINITSTGGGGSAYDTWAGGAVFTDDDNGDGVTNGMAFLLGAADPDEIATDRLPDVSKTGGGLVLTFNCLPLAARGTATLNVGHSSDLGISDAWLGAEVPDTTSGPVNGVSFVVGAGPAGPPATNSVTATISSSEAATGKLFGRLEGDQP